MCSLHLTHPSVHTWSSGQLTVQRPGSSHGFPVGAGIRTHNLGLPRVSSPTLYPLGQQLPTEVLEHFMLPAADQLYGDADLIFQQDLAPAHSSKATSTWFKDHGIPVLNWPAKSPDHRKSMGYCEEEDAICQTQQCRRAEGHYQSNLGSHNT